MELGLYFKSALIQEFNLIQDVGQVGTGLQTWDAQQWVMQLAHKVNLRHLAQEVKVSKWRNHANIYLVIR